MIFVSIIVSGIIGIGVGMLAGLLRQVGRDGHHAAGRREALAANRAAGAPVLRRLGSQPQQPACRHHHHALGALRAAGPCETLSLKARDYVLAARALGSSDFRLLLSHMLPNLLNSMIVLATLQIATIVLMEAALSFGVGIPPPTPAWGLMIAEGREVLEKAWWVSAMPGHCALARDPLREHGRRLAARLPRSASLRHLGRSSLGQVARRSGLATEGLSSDAGRSVGSSCQANSWPQLPGSCSISLTLIGPTVGSVQGNITQPWARVGWPDRYSGNGIGDWPPGSAPTSALGGDAFWL